MKLNLLNRWQHLQRVTQDIRKKWKRMSTLQQRSKSKKEHTTLEEEEDDKWPLAQVTEIHPGSGDLMRVALSKL